MDWQAYDLAQHESAPEARMGHSATLIDSTDTWGEELLIVFGKALQQARRMRRCRNLYSLRSDMHPYNKSCWKCKHDRNNSLSFGSCLSPQRGIEGQAMELGIREIEMPTYAGGLSAEKRALDDIHIFQVQSQVWSSPTIANAGPAPRSFHAAAANKLKLFIFGGHVYQKDRAVHKFGDLWCLDTVSYYLFCTAICMLGQIECFTLQSQVAKFLCLPSLLGFHPA